MTKVLLTGASGFVGSHLQRYLLEHTDWRVTALPTRALMGGIVSTERYDYIFHLASASSVEKSFQDPKNFIKNNLISTLNLLEYARHYPPKKLLHMSSVEVLTPSNPYAASKASQEAIVKSYALAYNIPTLIVRAGNIIGEGQGDDKFIPKIMKQIAAGETVDIYTAPDGVIGTRKYISVEYAVSMLTSLMQTDTGIITIEGAEAIDNLAMAKLIAEQMNMPLHYQLVQPTAVRPTYTSQFREASPNHAEGQDLEGALSWIR